MLAREREGNFGGGGGILGLKSGGNAENICCNVLVNGRYKRVGLPVIPPSTHTSPIFSGDFLGT